IGAVVILGVEHHRGSHLPQVGKTVGLASLFPRLGEDGKEDAREQSDDCNNDKKFDQSEAAASPSTRSAGTRVEEWCYSGQRLTINGLLPTVLKRHSRRTPGLRALCRGCPARKPSLTPGPLQKASPRQGFLPPSPRFGARLLVRPEVA